jgi:hypothetical protein
MRAISDEHPMPAVLPPRDPLWKAPRQEKLLFDQYRENLGRNGGSIRAKTFANVNPRTVKQDLDTAIRDNERLAVIRRLRAEGAKPVVHKRKELTPKKGMNELLELVVKLKQDVKMIKEAQSKKGAEDWIRNAGLQDFLFADEADFDDDGFPDILVRERAHPENAYIVNGYTTAPSLYPQRHEYYTDLPNVSDRKDQPFNKYIENLYSYTSPDDPLTRTSSPGIDGMFKLFANKGYAVKRPSKTISPMNGFKEFIMKPVIALIKKQGITLPREYIKMITDQYFHNLITFPALESVYGGDIYRVQDKTEINKLARRPEAKVAIRQFAINLIQNRLSIADELVNSITDQLTDAGTITGENASDFAYLVSGDLQEQYKADPEELLPVTMKQRKERMRAFAQ